VVRLAGGGLALGVCSYAASVAAGWGVDRDDGYIHWATTIALAAAVGSCALRAGLVGRERRAWAILAFAFGSYLVANVIWTGWLQQRDPRPYPSVADALWLAAYPGAYVAVGLLLRQRLPRLPRAVLLDGLVAALAVAAVASVVIAPAAARNSEGLGTLAQVITFAYPLLDLVLLAVIGFVFAVTGGRPGRTWAVLAAAGTSLAIADAVWSHQVAGLIGGTTALPNVLWVLAWALFALAAWQPPAEPTPRSEGRIAPAVVLAALTCVLAMLRTMLTVAEERTLAESRRQALTDELTGLPNRRSFLGRLAEAIEAAGADGRAVALLMIDLDRFKELNDTLGHAAGDDLLASLGPRLAEVVGRQGRIARLGGDEFGVIVPRTTPGRALALAEALRDAIGQPFAVRGLRVSVGASVGVATFPTHATSGEALLQRADVAMYQAKHAGRGVELYAAERDGHSRDRLVLASELRQAIHDDELTVLYQPKAGARDGMVRAVEALVRWQHPLHGAIPPGQFVPIAEQTGLGRALTRRVLEHAVRQAARWHARGRSLSVAVNLCAVDLADREFPDDVARALARWRLPAELLQVEVTENNVLADPVGAQLVLARLAELGVRSSLDDFGTGHSSLTHLRRLPVAELKLDRSFVAGMVTDHQDAAIVGSTVDLARRLGLRVVAEGVEDDATWMLLRDIGCDEIQGFLLSPPLSPAALEAWLDDRARLRDDLPAIQEAPAEGR